MEGAARVDVRYHLIWLADASTETGGERDMAFADLLGGYDDESALMVWPGIHTGTIEFTWTLHAVEPPRDRQGWDDVAEGVVALPSGVLAVRGFSWDERVVEHAPGRYAVRCWARGRDLDHDGAVVGTARETFHLDLWLVEQLPAWVEPPPMTRVQQQERMVREIAELDQEPQSGPLGPQPQRDRRAHLPGGGEFLRDGAHAPRPHPRRGEPAHPTLRQIYRLARAAGVRVSWQPAGTHWEGESVMVGVTDTFVDGGGRLMWIGPDHDGVPEPLPPGTAAQTLALMRSQPEG